jgi:ABC-type nitrate/sulfonate/bicarbonate transport system ATPase subunit
MEHLASQAKIQFKSFSKSFGDLLVLDDLNFQIEKNEFFCIVGPTGCGKTTLCNLVTTLIPPSAGMILIDGEPANPRRHNISFVFQEPSCLEWRTVWDNVKFGLEIKGYPENAIIEKCKTVMRIVGLDGFEDYFPNQISAGMKQRVAIARAFVTDPDLLLMDEPFGQLDIKKRFMMLDEVLRLWRELKATIIYVTHNLEEAVYLARNIAVLSQKPTKIKEIVPVDLPYPRDYTDDQFVAVRRYITDLVKWW